MYVDVAVPVKVGGTFTYRLPEEMSPSLGARVVVPFGKKLVTGYIIAVREALPPDLSEVSIKPIVRLVDQEPLVTGEILELTRWVAEYYFAPWGEVLQAAVPSGMRLVSEEIVSLTEAGRQALEEALTSGRKVSRRVHALAMLADVESLPLTEWEKKFGKTGARAILRELERRGYVRTRYDITGPPIKPKEQELVVVPETLPPDAPRSPSARRVLEVLVAAGGPLALGELAVRAAVKPAVIRRMAQRQHVTLIRRPVRRDPFVRVGDVPPPPAFELTAEQAAALARIEEKLDEGTYASFLLHGVTGSGKTEVYIRAMHAALRRGKTALMLVPEIALTPMLSRRLRAHFGQEVAILHSSLSEGERSDEWMRIARREARVVIGTRSAVFAPLERLGLVVVDEEHDGSYKQDDSPRYHGRDTAIVRAHRQNAVVILGSATPSMESFHNVHTGKYIYLPLGERIGGRPLAKVELVDMRQVFARHGRQHVLSEELLEALHQTAERGEQAILLVNRRGFSAFVLCRRCGLTIRCIRCDVALTYHRSTERLVCHYCNFQMAVPTCCPRCGGQYIYFVGVGTEQVEERLKRLFPRLRVARLDRDTARRRGAHERILQEFASGAIDTLIGTQMVAKGHDFPNVTLVGVISVDAGLGLPDFRAAERTFQLLTQVAGRAGRGDSPGRVIIQTYYPEHYALQFAQAQDYEGFYRREIQFRQALHYPPVTTLIQVIVHHRRFERAQAIATELVHQLRVADPLGQVRTLGPAPAPRSRLRGEYRLQILLKTRQRLAAHHALQQALDALRAAGTDTYAIAVDVDPVDVM
jgi:primosomal protein N' (replication factor Y)